MFVCEQSEGFSSGAFLTRLLQCRCSVSFLQYTVPSVLADNTTAIPVLDMLERNTVETSTSAASRGLATVAGALMYTGHLDIYCCDISLDITVLKILVVA